MIPVAQAHVQVAVGSDPGLRGKNNEDRYAVSAYILSDSKPIPSVLAIVADGIGGHRAGEVAAEMAVENISRLVASSDASQPVETLQNAITLTSQAIYKQAENDPDLYGMGTTCSCCWIIGNHLYTCTVGDSRIYLVRDNTIQQLSTDHTWMQEVIDNGTMSPEQARGHPNQHVIRRFLGSREPPYPDMRLRLKSDESFAQSVANQGLILVPNDQILTCTDGLTDLVNQTEILAELKRQRGQAAVNGLVQLANQRGGHDNITVLLLEMPAVEKQKAIVAPRRNLVFTCLAVSVLVLASIAFLAGNWLFNWNPFGGGSNRPTETLVVTPDGVFPKITPGLATDFPPIEQTLEPPSSGNVNGSGRSPVLSPIPNQPTLTPWPTNTP